ncbi:hypothetical protein Rcae01_05601 [Novipirellula caenicola]|uniref:Uncharacterized protein n=1 Tax=Novipirellula caenicola TaxID=1536901 RepID=A0ABP9W0S1_9BACT
MDFLVRQWCIGRTRKSVVRLNQQSVKTCVARDFIRIASLSDLDVGLGKTDVRGT